MGPRPKREKGITFSLVHRDSHDPLYHDVDAPERVLVPVVSGNRNRRKDAQRLSELDSEAASRYAGSDDEQDLLDSDGELDDDLIARLGGVDFDDDEEEAFEPDFEIDGPDAHPDGDDDDLAAPRRHRDRAPVRRHVPGEAAKYGIFFDDRDYNYMQHLRPMVGGPGAVFIAAKGAEPTRVRGDGGFTLRDSAAPGSGGDRAALTRAEVERLNLPSDILPASYSAVEYAKTRGAFVPELGTYGKLGSVGGPRPDLSEDILEVLEALDDEEYLVDGDFEDDFFAKADAKPTAEDRARQRAEAKASRAATGPGAMPDDDEIRRLMMADHVDEFGNPIHGEEEYYPGGDSDLDAHGSGGGYSDEDGSGSVNAGHDSRSDLGFSDEFDDDEFDDDEEYGDFDFDGGRHPARRSVRFADGDNDRYFDSRTVMTTTSASLARTESLRFLDDRFEQLLNEYDVGDIGELDEEDPTVMGHADMARYESILDEFLTAKRKAAADKGLVGLERLRGSALEAMATPGPASASAPAESPATGAQQQQQQQSAISPEAAAASAALLQQDVARYITKYAETVDESGNLPDEHEEVEVEPRQKEAEFDCESILSTYSNISNRPSVLSESRHQQRRMTSVESLGGGRSSSGFGLAPAPAPAIKIKIGRSGVPIGGFRNIQHFRAQARQESSQRKGGAAVAAAAVDQPPSSAAPVAAAIDSYPDDYAAEEGYDQEDGGDDYEDYYASYDTGPAVAARPRDETPEEKRARKKAIKEQRSVRRATKKATTTAFKTEKTRIETQAIRQRTAHNNAPVIL
ncbi:hypothetical protein H696_04537 [Fonticula alba]|uniref:Protein LTV1 homolog n=1 Tax=Fonticula alba TaxID=691883 RepID=A0A058Z4R4_FONAL|nr:hypothetical protein H696_04537 [Fonticula alba]KCV69121.1 hypothetical protein H696_04537 [Fonticula alba]|eukprot:XP_009496692.1 hypothetical protein H696_04537 [Fonticula alba]